MTMTPEDVGKYVLVLAGAVAFLAAAWRIVSAPKDRPWLPGLIVMALGLAGMGTGTYGIPFLTAEAELIKQIRKLKTAGPSADVAASVEAVRANRLAPDDARVLLMVARAQAPEAFENAFRPPPVTLPASVETPPVKSTKPEIASVLTEFAQVATADAHLRADLKAGLVPPNDLLKRLSLAAHTAVPTASPIS